MIKLTWVIGLKSEPFLIQPNVLSPFAPGGTNSMCTLLYARVSAGGGRPRNSSSPSSQPLMPCIWHWSSYGTQASALARRARAPPGGSDTGTLPHYTRNFLLYWCLNLFKDFLFKNLCRFIFALLINMYGICWCNKRGLKVSHFCDPNQTC